MTRGLLLTAALAAAFGAAAPASAQVPPDPEPVVQPGVTVAGVDLGGLTAVEAAAALQAFFDQPFAVAVGGLTFTPDPADLDSRARVGRAAGAALAAPAGTALRLEVVVREWVVRKWIRRVAKRYDRGPVSTRARLVGLRPRLTRPRAGRELMQKRSTGRVVRALRRHVRDFPLPVKRIRPAVVPRTHGPVVVILRGSKRLTLYRSAGVGPMRARASFGVATGMAAYPTPVGNFRIVTRQRNPWWYPPPAGWAAGAKPIPPGPGNPLGTRWMGLNVGAVGIHGTPDAASIGYSASHGCIRMLISQAEWLFERVRVGTRVFIRAA
ncbi:MAG: L,D-transpeptidase [Gaiellaceae bacterium]